MFDCSTDLCKYHDQEVNLPEAERSNMRDRRNANRDRLKRGLTSQDKPVPIEFKSQGSYAMRTMKQDVNNDYDIDDGVYFHREDLVGPRGGEMSTLQSRDMVRDAVDDGSFNKSPEVRSNCVRVYYEQGYHVDLPVYRRVVVKNSLGAEVEVYYELAASSGWKRSDARDVTSWYEDERAKSLDGQQMRRINRVLKMYAHSRDSWRDSILCGFGITVLVVECFKANGREDLALYETMVAIRDRLVWNLEIQHPVTPGDYITKDENDAHARFFLEKLDYAINELEPLSQFDCTREKALKCWDKVFNTAFFGERFDEERSASKNTSGYVSSAAVLASTGQSRAAVKDSGSDRFA